MEWLASVTPRPRFTPGERTPVSIGQEAEWASEAVWIQGLQEKSFCPAGDRTSIAAVHIWNSKNLSHADLISADYVFTLQPLVGTSVQKNDTRISSLKTNSCLLTTGILSYIYQSYNIILKLWQTKLFSTITQA
jgi:hypothetical protein